MMKVTSYSRRMVVAVLLMMMTVTMMITSNRLVTEAYMTATTIKSSTLSRISHVRTSARQLPVTTRVRPTKTTKMTTSSSLNERRWNFNDGQSPWGMKKNAEIWNGRFAQMAFVIVMIQELIQGKGVIEGIQQGDPFNVIMLGLFGISAVGLTGFLALQGDDDYVQ